MTAESALRTESSNFLTLTYQCTSLTGDDVPMGAGRRKGSWAPAPTPGILEKNSKSKRIKK
jgi:hypothetical protein